MLYLDVLCPAVLRRAVPCQAIEMVLRTAGLLGSNVMLPEAYPAIERQFKGLWADHGDAVSTQYAGDYCLNKTIILFIFIFISCYRYLVLARGSSRGCGRTTGTQSRRSTQVIIVTVIFIY